jgi:hypothetical protein
MLRPFARTQTVAKTTTEARGLQIVGHAAYFSPPPAPAIARKAGIEAARAARAAGRNGDADAEQHARRALELLVDAFLVDRVGNSDCFARAHALGLWINRRFGCQESYDSEDESFVNKCGVLALHSRIALSPGGTTTGICSICGAADFECDHVSGRIYDGERCYRTIVEWNLAEISLVRVPYDPRCYRIAVPRTKAEVEATLGKKLAPGELPGCHHCAICEGRYGPNEDDLDPSHWEDLPQEG